MPRGNIDADLYTVGSIAVSPHEAGRSIKEFTAHLVFGITGGGGWCRGVGRCRGIRWRHGGGWCRSVGRCREGCWCHGRVGKPLDRGIKSVIGALKVPCRENVNCVGELIGILTDGRGIQNL